MKHSTQCSTSPRKSQATKTITATTTTTTANICASSNTSRQLITLCDQIEARFVWATSLLRCCDASAGGLLYIFWGKMQERMPKALC